MAEFYLDHDVAIEVVRLLIRADHGARSTRALSRERATDDEQLLLAANNRWVFVTHNEADFRLLHDAWRRWSNAWHVTAEHAGILVLRRAPAPDLAEALDALAVAGPPLSNRLYTCSRGRGWAVCGA